MCTTSIEAANTYNADGNLLSGGNRSYVWNADNQSTIITGTDGIRETYVYDAEGERVKRTRGNTTTVYLGDWWKKNCRAAPPARTTSSAAR